MDSVPRISGCQKFIWLIINSTRPLRSATKFNQKCTTTRLLLYLRSLSWRTLHGRHSLRTRSWWASSTGKTGKSTISSNGSRKLNLRLGSKLLKSKTPSCTPGSTTLARGRAGCSTSWRKPVIPECWTRCTPCSVIWTASQICGRVMLSLARSLLKLSKSLPAKLTYRLIRSLKHSLPSRRRRRSLKQSLPRCRRRSQPSCRRRSSITSQSRPSKKMQRIQKRAWTLRGPPVWKSSRKLR